MEKISAIIIAKNEENMIADCIDSLNFCDEIIIVDNDSEDNTKELAKHLGAKAYSIKSSDFSQIRNFGFSKALYEWVLYIDGDERVSKALAQEIKDAISKDKNKNIAGFKLRRKNFYLGDNPWPYIESLERLFRKERLKGWHGKIHESPIFQGSTETLNNYLLHFTHRNLGQMLEKTIEWSKIEAENRFNSNHPKMTWWRFPRVMTTTFFNFYIFQKGYKAGTIGIIESIYQSFSVFITYARLWDMQRRSKLKKMQGS